MEKIPFKRIMDLQASFLSSWPDSISVCIDGHFSWKAALGGCAGVNFFGFLSSIYAGMRGPFHVVRIGEQRYRVWSAGISAGTHIVFTSPRLWPQSPHPDWASADIFGTIEMVQWRAVRRHNLGFTIQFDLGAATAFNLRNPSQTLPAPLFNFSLGLAW